jgi:hypothetical protein
MIRPPVARSTARQDQAAMRKYNGDKRYSTGAFPKLSRVVRARNPICQKIVNAGLYRNEQCHSPSVLVHHYHSPRTRPDLFLSVYDENGVSNLIALCAQCHCDSDGTDGENGAPLWVEGVDFVRTEFKQWQVG